MLNFTGSPQLTTANRTHSSCCQRNPQYFGICHQGPVSLPCLCDTLVTYSYFETPSGNIKRIIILSSVAAIGLYKTDSEHTEEEWNDRAINDVKANGKASNGNMKYMASKTLAERGAAIITKGPRSARLRRELH